MTDGNTRVPEIALVAKRQRLELSTPLHRGWDCGRNKQVDALQVNQSWLVSVACSGSDDQDMAMLKDFTVANRHIGKGERNFPETNGEELHARAGPDCVRVSLLTFILGQRSEDPHSWLKTLLPLRRSIRSLASPRGSLRLPRPAETLVADSTCQRSNALILNVKLASECCATLTFHNAD
jgi:hypothetical protein